ncbi:MAG TPA: HEAT repeat domain-containing protein, partial [Gemmatimonadaceae bacterium]|nr:HEAT repeat domain-containing protein [Gemmatimonadaceae bacterium]
ALPGVPDLRERMQAHGVDELQVGANAVPADLLGLARALAAAPAPTTGPAVLSLTTVRVVPTPPPPAAPAPAAPAVAPAPASVAPPPVPPAPSAAPPPRPPTPPIPFGAGDVMNLGEGLSMELELVEPDEAHAAIVEKLGEEATAPPAAPVMPGLVVETPDVMLLFAATLKEGDPQAILAQLDATTVLHHRAIMLDEVANLIERSAREGKAMLAADLVGGLVKREAETPDGSEERKMWGRVVRRLLKAGVLRQVAMLLPRKRGRIEEYEAVLIRAGEDGADALIEQLTQATTAEDRRTYYNLLVRLRAGVAALVHMLGDHRWYVARNAADLLGEMQAHEGEPGLIQLLHHADDRVRRAASIALVRLGTTRAVQAVHDAMRAESSDLRLMAAAALGSRKDHQTAQTLVKAFEKEQNEEVQLAIIAALGRVGTPDAVNRLILAAEPGGRLFNKKSITQRLAAVQALADARTPAAMAALKALGDDREREVKEAATRALARG